MTAGVVVALLVLFFVAGRLVEAHHWRRAGRSSRVMTSLGYHFSVRQEGADDTP